MIIDTINDPSDLKKLDPDKLPALADEIRKIIIETVSLNGGHLASSLGVVELTLALHYVFNSPVDKLIWDVGHQAYCHKIITGRKDRFPTIRKDDGISGFPKMSESRHDAFGTGHSSTSISAALGILEGRDMKKESFKVIAVIGDGAMSGGLAFEGLNNAGHLKKDLIVILNDNEMSISKNVGALSAYMNRILTGDFYRKFKKETKSFLEGIPRVGGPVAKIAQKAEETIKGILLPGILFEELGFDYIGPIDGHSIEQLVETLSRIKDSSSPTLIHIITKKGKGYEFSEKDPCVFHGVGPFELDTGSQLCSSSPTYSRIFGETLTELANKDERIVAISAAMREGTGLDVFAESHQGRFYDVGIAEPHAVTFAAGLAAAGMKPVVAIYSTFLQRAYDQIIHDVCLQNLPVVFAVDRAGIVGEDGPTHNGLFDISYLRHIPNLIFLAPKDGNELKKMLEFSLKENSPVVIRYPRGKAPSNALPCAELSKGKSEILLEGSDIAIFAVGQSAYAALSAAEKLKKTGIHATVVNARFITPPDKETILALAGRTNLIVTIEENTLAGGFGSSLMEVLSDAEVYGIKIKRIGIRNAFLEQGSQDNLRKKYSLDEDGIFQAISSFIAENDIHRMALVDVSSKSSAKS